MFQSLIQKARIFTSHTCTSLGALSKHFIEVEKQPLVAAFNSDITLNPNPWKYKRISRRKHNGRVRQERIRPVEENNVSEIYKFLVFLFYFNGFLQHSQDKPMQMDWWDYDGVGRYRSRKHGYPQNRMLRDVQNRRVLEKYNQERTLVNAVWKVHPT